MKRFGIFWTIGAGAAIFVSVAAFVMNRSVDDRTRGSMPALDPNLIAQGQEIFRFDTFGNETFWTDTLRLHEVINSSVDPTTALEVGRSPAPFPYKITSPTALP